MALLLTFGAIAVFVWAAATDLASRRIANRAVAALAALALVRIAGEALGGGGLGPAARDLFAGAVVFAAGAALFRFDVFGGGDAKLLAAGALWVGAGGLAPFLGATALLGGVLAVGALAWVGATGRRAGAGLAAGPSLPYGVAIAAGGVAVSIARLVGA